MSLDPVTSNPDHYKVVFENERVRVLEFTDGPGDRTTPHEHPDSVMLPLSSFRRRLYGTGGAEQDVDITSGKPGWLAAQQHAGHNIGDTETHVIFVELKEAASPAAGSLGPTGPALEQD